MSKNRSEILGIGSPIIDLIAHVDEDFLSIVPGRKGGMELIDESTFNRIIEQLPSPPTYVPGGSTANVLRTLAHLGHHCTLIGKLGKDHAGDVFIKQLNTLSIKAHCKRIQKPTAQVISLVTPDGQRTCRTFLGAAADMNSEDLTESNFKGMKLVHIEGYSLDNYPLAEKAMIFGKMAGAKISLDLASFEIVERHKSALFYLLNRYVDIVFGNAEEAMTLTGLSPDAACSILKEICSLAIVSINKEGCWIGQNHELLKCNAYPKVSIDSTGAGDLFAGGFLHGYLTGKPLVVCAHYGSLLGAAIVQVHGTELPQTTWTQLKQEILTNSQAHR